MSENRYLALRSKHSFSYSPCRQPVTHEIAPKSSSITSTVTDQSPIQFPETTPKSHGRQRRRNRISSRRRSDRTCSDHSRHDIPYDATIPTQISEESIADQVMSAFAEAQRRGLQEQPKSFPSYKHVEFVSEHRSQSAVLRAYRQLLVPARYWNHVNLSDNCGETVLWDMVSAVRVLSTDIPRCTICMGPPCCVRALPCGHCFCAFCLKQLCDFQDKPVCPECHSPVHEADSRMALYVDVPQHHVGSEISLSRVAPLLDHTAFVVPSCRGMVSASEIETSFSPVAKLTHRLFDSMAAMDLAGLNRQMENWELQGPSIDVLRRDVQRKHAEILEMIDDSYDPTPPCLLGPVFYQEHNGSMIFLSPLSMSMLRHANMLDDTLTFNIHCSQYGEVSHQSPPYLHCLPEGTGYTLVDPPLDFWPSETLDAYAKPIKKREKMLLQKKRKEDRLNAKIEREATERFLKTALVAAPPDVQGDFPLLDGAQRICPPRVVVPAISAATEEIRQCLSGQRKKVFRKKRPAKLKELDIHL